MRLIDADKIYWEYKCISKEEIDDEPTIKAIPIEFIERKLAEHWYVDYDVRELLDDWEKENEKDI